MSVVAGDRFELRVAANLRRLVKADRGSAAAVARKAYSSSSPTPESAARKLQRQISAELPSPVSTRDAASLANVLGVDPSEIYAPIAGPDPALAR